MDRRQILATAAASAGLLAVATSADAAKPPTTWDDLVLVKSKRLDLVYLSPGADFRIYSKVMLDPTEIAFHKDWRKDYNATTTGLSGRVSEKDILDVIEDARTGADGIFAKAAAAGGYPVVAEPGEDVLRLRTAILNVRVSAPEQRTSARSYTFSDDAGEATLVVEARDSLTGAILGRAVDRRLAGDTTSGVRNRVTNRSDFRRLASNWAKISVQGLEELKALSPINASGQKNG